MTLPVLSGVQEIAHDYDALILDLWGVVHNGVEPYPGVLDCLENLRDAGKQVLLLSNAPRVSTKVGVQIAGFGVPRDAYDDVVTSGDVTRLSVRRREDAWHAALGDTFFHVGPERDWGLLDGIGVDEVDDIDKAAFVLNSGLRDDESETEADYDELFGRALSRKLPMICANPDLSVMRGETMVLCAGAIATHYEAMGGEVMYHGKPHARAYQVCFEKLEGVARQRIIAVGDSYRTDIAGANAAGIASLFVAGGIHGEELGVASGHLDADRVTEAATAAGHLPTAAIAGFFW
jgi:HAD superfamily hydrolase (TIGR01459 family)